MPTSKIEAGKVKEVMKWSNPSVDISKLELPKRTNCASCMRRDELKVVSNAHKATVLCDQIAEGASLKINTDGTTKHQKKIAGIAINDMTISINEVADGSSSTAIESREIEKLQKIANALGIPNASSINWSLIEASTSDSAATQKHFYEKKEAERETLTRDSAEAHIVFIENFCSMHLGVNIRKAFLRGLHSQICEDNSSAAAAKYPVDVLCTNFAKFLASMEHRNTDVAVKTFQIF